MEKNEILKRSKKFYHNSDPYEKQCWTTGSYIGDMASLGVSLVLFIAEYFIKHEHNYGIIGVAFLSTAVQCVYTSIKSPRRATIAHAIFTGLLAIIYIVLHIISLVRV